MKIIVMGEVRGKGRPRFTKSGQVYTDSKTKAYEEKISAAYKATGFSMIPKFFPVKADITACFPVPKSISKAQRKDMLAGKAKPCKKPDLDNIVKVVMDALNGVAYADDKQVVAIIAQKRYSYKSGLIVDIQIAEGEFVD